ncbi:efflux RND transporter periplasmic adaptor subunit [Aliidiomarina quisquiliarum]|uniref:efflux RND transporter periplasmic adaptor subunit n=1 Tax=Aliidiomarina quisquiliarum TaxID=2938947 RepID=UPI00208F2FD4|nr:efflux RND transporter periplasmic adaptor subunit [Aliidiomarina quisquiliarum]MCO4322565.1 efflux RND transporter periplasmic adaptor subunit [Aliidiomarina quisquiliarum]
MKPLSLQQLPTVLSVLFAAFFISACAAEEAQELEAPKRPLPRVFAVTVAAENLEIERSFSARTEGSMVAAVTARAGGQIESREFKEGQLVPAGTVMFRLEKAPYEVTLQQAKADLSQAEAEHATARRDWNRVMNLYDDGAISARDRDQAQSKLEITAAGLESTRARLDDASLRYNYTEVKAPITGIASRERVSVGNVIGEGDSLAVVTAMDPLYVRFSVPENGVAARYLLANSSLTAVTDPTQEVSPAEPHEHNVRLSFADGREHSSRGYIDYVSRVVDRNTGNMEARAVIPNPNLDLLPGQFVRVELPKIVVADAISVPQRSVVQSGRRSVVYIVDEEDRVRVREVTLGVRVDNEQLIEDGLANGDRVIVEGLSMLQPGARVRVEDFE